MSSSSEQSKDGCEGSEGDQRSAAGRVETDGQQRQLRSDLRKKSSSDFPQLTVDTNTVHKYIKLSDNNTTMTFLGTEDQHYPDHPDRFAYWNQLLCKEGLTGVHYWEVQCGDSVSIAVSYIGIERKDAIRCMFGNNKQSWGLYCYDEQWSVFHDKRVEEIQSVPHSDKVGVLLDHRAGTLTFYAVHAFDMTEIYTYRTTFTEPLYPGFTVWSSISLLTTAS